MSGNVMKFAMYLLPLLGTMQLFGKESTLAYGQHPRQYVKFTPAEAPGVRPALIYFHGGGFKQGSPDYGPFKKELLKAGVSVVAAAYRLRSDNVTKQETMEDGIRAIQCLRLHADKLKLDPNRIGAMGSSAGGHLAAWLGYHDDVADPNASEALLRQSSRAQVVVLERTQPFPLTIEDWHLYTGLPHALVEQTGYAYVQKLLQGDWFKQPFERKDFENEAQYLEARRAYEARSVVFNLVSPGDAPTAFHSKDDPDPAKYLRSGKGVDLHSPALMIPLKNKLEAFDVDTYWGHQRTLDFVLKYLIPKHP